MSSFFDFCELFHCYNNLIDFVVAKLRSVLRKNWHTSVNTLLISPRLMHFLGIG